MNRRCTLALLLVASFPVAACASQTAAGDSAAVPQAMRGTWAHGSCSIAANTLVITGTTAALGTAKPQSIVYYPNDAGPGNGAIHWRQEGDVDNFVYRPASKAIVHNAQGYHMPGAILYTRCSS